ncbi:MAG: LapA family protein [Chloroflexota bacterium]
MTEEVLKSGPRITLGSILALVLGTIVVIWALANSAETQVNFLVTSVVLPLFLVIIGVLAIGFILGWLMHASRSRR